MFWGKCILIYDTFYYFGMNGVSIVIVYCSVIYKIGKVYGGGRYLYWLDRVLDIIVVKLIRINEIIIIYYIKSFKVVLE